jgi:hypothetical protein
MVKIFSSHQIEPTHTGNDKLTNHQPGGKSASQEVVLPTFAATQDVYYIV